MQKKGGKKRIICLYERKNISWIHVCLSLTFFLFFILFFCQHLKKNWERSVSTLSTIVIHTYFCQKEISPAFHFSKGEDFGPSETYKLRIAYTYFYILCNYHPPVQRSDLNGNERYNMRDWGSCDDPAAFTASRYNS